MVTAQDSSLALLVHGLKECSHLRVLDLTGNTGVTKAGNASLQQLMRTQAVWNGSVSTVPAGQCRLEELTLDQIPLGSAGFHMLCESLKQNQELRRLSVKLCDISAITASFSTMLAVNSTLQSLHLGSNRCDPTPLRIDCPICKPVLISTQEDPSHLSI